MLVLKRRCSPLLLSLLISPTLSALELGLDAGFQSGTLVDDWGVSGRAQVIGASGFGLDIGYSYFNSLSYSALNQSVSHSFGQYEMAGVWQSGNEGFRFQLLAGGILSNRTVQVGSDEVIAQYAPGYRLDAGVSVPVFTRVRAFAEAGYQGWLNAEVPRQVRWRYGLRLLLGGNAVQPLERDVDAANAAMAAQQQRSLEAPVVTIDPDVPRYVPSHLSQSLPPIVANSELCKCFPAGPYTLQLGEFSSMPQAIRGLEYRGLRQFFNSRAYLRSPLPVFLAQAEQDGPVGLYLGELTSVNDMQYWRHELRKNGLQARYRKVVSVSGDRIDNPIVAVDEAVVDTTPRYTEEQIRRMNSLPAEGAGVNGMAPTASADNGGMSDWQDEDMARLNRVVDNPTQEALVAGGLQLGPLQRDELLALLTTQTMKSVLARDPVVEGPMNSVLIWDESRDEAWVFLHGFGQLRQLDEWRAWLESEGMTVDLASESVALVGDIYRFGLARALNSFSVEMDRQPSAEALLNSLRSPEVLWFQAFQRINDVPVETSLNYSRRDNRYRLIAVDIENESRRAKVWSDLTAVGLLPALAEE